MNRFFLSLLASVISLSSMAQLGADGYYRVKGYKTGRFVIMIDNKSKGLNSATTTYDLDALMTVKPFSRICNDPSSVIYIENRGNDQYNLKAQGSDAYDAVGRLVTITLASASQQTYYASATAQGTTVYLYDEAWNGDEGRLSTNGSNIYRHWNIMPISHSDNDNYFGINGELAVSGKYYTPFYASFPFTFSSSGMKAYVVTRIDGDLAIWAPVEGKVAASTPVIIESSNASASDSRLNLELQNGTAPTRNLMRGVYFNNTDIDYITETSYHFNATRYDAATMRLLGVTSSGKVGFVKSNLKYIPHNAAYLPVPEGSPDEITLVTQEEYDEIVAADNVIVTARSYSRLYGDPNPAFEYDVEGNIKGEPTLTCSATQSSPVGVYPIVVGQGTVSNRGFQSIDGTLTITKAPLTFTARSYTIKQNEQLPAFAYDVTGFKLNETTDVLTSQAVISCDVPENKEPGTYPIVVSGAAAGNYEISYVAGTLTILQADPVTVSATSLSKVYGDEMPLLTWTMEGGSLKGEPQLTCEATQQSPVGTYPITVSKGTLDYPNLILVDGTLTVTKAALTFTARSYTIKQNEELPAFAYDVTGFKLDETTDVLTSQATISCDVPENKEPGTYPIVVSGAAADNYEVSFVAGTLTILQADPVTIRATSLSKVYGDEMPLLTWTIEGGTLEGEPQLSCDATQQSAVGIYPITVSKGTLDYPNLILVDGSLSVTKAPLTISAGDYTMKQTDELPEFKASFEGFKLEDTEAVLTQQPVLTTDAPADNTPGEYTVTVSGAEAENYDISYRPGRLIITEVDQIVLMASDATMVYGDDVPAFTYTVSGGEVEGEAVVSCEATSGSPVGTYTIVIEKGTVDYPNLKLVNGTLTITPATLIASVGDYHRDEGEPNPDFEILYEGFRNGDDASVLIAAPEATTTATVDSEPGVYDIVLSGGKAQNYVFTYVNGRLTINKIDAVNTPTLAHPVDVYTLTGRKVLSQATSLRSLPKGIYVVDGRKVVVK